MTIDKDKKTQELSEQEQKFLDILFDVHKGDIRKAMTESGYSKSVPTSVVRNKLKVRIMEEAAGYLSANTAKAVISITDVLDDPTAMGASNVLKAAKEILDRSGVNAPEAKEKVIERNIFFLPMKNTDDGE